ncbi:MAG TPA: hypothetical protein VGP74_06320 [Rubrobacteraceae bacterium]|jgi:hypothetical protein|nr:hypothetical protein [Rubrobacteraceae bacterium]
MTRRLKAFSLCAVLWAGAYLWMLSRMLEVGKTPSAPLVSGFVVFTVVLSSLEELFRGRDDQRQVRYNLALRYSTVAAVASFAVAAGWVLAWRHDGWLVAGLAVASALVVVGIAQWSTRAKIKGYSNDELFR